MSETTAISGQDTIQESFVKRINALQADNKNLAEELETTKVEREEVRAKLFESLIANKKYLREVERLKKENILLKRMPLFLVTVIEMGPDYVLLRQHGNNQGGDPGCAGAEQPRKVGQCRTCTRRRQTKEMGTSIPPVAC